MTDLEMRMMNILKKNTIPVPKNKCNQYFQALSRLVKKGLAIQTKNHFVISLKGMI